MHPAVKATTAVGAHDHQVGLVDLCLVDGPELPEKGSVVAGSAMLTASVLSPMSGGGCGGCGSSCGCGGH